MERPELALERLTPEQDSDERDLEIVQRCIGGDRNAFTEVVERYKGGIYALCVRLSGNGAIGEELAQETFARAWTALGAWRRDAKFRYWLYRIAVNLCRDFAKAGGRRERASAEPGEQPYEEAHGEGPANPQAHAISRQVLQALERAVARLPAKYREAFVLKHFEGLPYEEIKAILKAPVPVLKVRVHRAREKLRRELSDLLV